MNQNQLQKLQTPVKYSKNHILFKKTLQFLISISLFSLLLICHSSTFCFFYRSIYFYFNTFIAALFTHTVERKYIFLLCNGILAFLSMNLGFCNSSRVGSDLGKYEDGGKSVSELSETKAPVVDKEEAMESNVSLENVALVVHEEEEEEEENGSLNTEVDESGALVIEEEEEESGSLITAEATTVAAKRDEQEEEGNEELSNTEELNRKFDEFIRRMKEELRIEARRQLIAV